MIKRLLLILFIVFYAVFLHFHNEANRDELITLSQCDLYSMDCPVREAIVDTIEDKIVSQAEFYGVNKDTALRIAHCESSFNQYAANKHSTAKGVYQFLDSTWSEYCDGDVYDADANIECFMKLYPSYPQWWECK